MRGRMTCLRMGVEPALQPDITNKRASNRHTLVNRSVDFVLFTLNAQNSPFIGPLREVGVRWNMSIPHLEGGEHVVRLHKSSTDAQRVVCQPDVTASDSVKSKLAHPDFALRETAFPSDDGEDTIAV